MLSHLKALLPSIVLLVCARVTFLVYILKTDAFKTWVSFLLTQKTGKAPIPGGRSIISLVLEAGTILVKNLVLRNILGVLLVYIVLVSSIDLLPLDVKLAKLLHVVDHLVAHFDSFSGLIESIFVPMDLRQDGAVLQLELTNNEYLPHAIRDALFLKVEHRYRQVLESMFNALSTLFKHLHFLVA